MANEKVLTVKSATPTVRKTRVSTVNPNETKTDKFIRLANVRVNKILKALKQINALGGPGYESTELQRKSVETALTSAFNVAIDGLNKKTVQSTSFKL